MGNIANIAVQLTANAGGVKRGVTDAKASLNSLKGAKTGNPFATADKGARGMASSAGMLTSKLGALGAAMTTAFSVTAIAGSIKASLEMMDSQKELADQLGISVKALSGLSYISDVVGGDTAALSGSIAKMQKLFGNAANGQKAATDTLAKYGLAAKDLIGLPLEDQIGKISDKFKTLDSQEQKVVMATDLFGKSGASMINMLALGSGEMDKMIGKAEDLGIVFTDKMAQGASDATDAMLEYNMALMGATNTMATEFAPAATMILQKLTAIMPLIPKLAGSIPGVGNLMVDPSDYMFKDSKYGPTAIPSGAGPLVPTGAKAVDSLGVPGSIFDTFSPKKMAAGAGVISQSSKDMAIQGGKNYVDSLYSDITDGSLDNPSDARIAPAMEGVDALLEQIRYQKVLDAADKDRAKELADQTKELEAQTNEKEKQIDLEGGFMIGKAGRTALGGGGVMGQSGMGDSGGIPNIDVPMINIPMINIPQIGVPQIGANQVYGGANGNGSGMGKENDILSELKKQTAIARAAQAQPLVASFA